ncbi:hypothetical protein [Microcoleus sp. CAWBG58]|uniref:hypothetical protein n=1 Tax=Microcoleus sp. CAWBG58 TaxID=2841651 RepID=UPI0025E2F0F0|nr:hypothetical protein [Microcoleus sp. CAWBG58]
MLEQIPLVLAVPIAKVILDKFYEGVGSKLGEVAAEKLPAKVKQLGQLVWEKCLRGKPGTDKLLEAAANGLEKEQATLKEYLCKVLESDSLFNREVGQLANEIHQAIQFDDINAQNVQQIFGGQGLQVNDPKSQVIQAGENAKFYFGTQPQD